MTTTMETATLDSIRKQEASLLIPTYERVPVLFERGEGVQLFDSEGRAYLDFLSGIGVNALGHAHPRICAAITAQMQLIHISNLFFHEYQAPLAARLTQLSGLDRAFFCNSGTEAWECAIKLSRAYAREKSGGAKKKARFLMMKNSFHGRTMGSLATTGNAKYRAPFAPMLPGVTFVRFNDVADLEAKFDSSVCAIGMETIQGEGGVHPVSRRFLERARELTRDSGALLMLDEIQCGLGRTGKMFAYQHYGIEPDIVTVAKPLAAGLPLGAVLASNEVAAAFRPGMHGTTFGGGPLACAVALAFLDEISQPGFLGNVAAKGDYFRDRLLHVKTRHSCVRDVRVVGLMAAIELDSVPRAKRAVFRMMERGFIINRTHDVVLRFLPPYIVEAEHIDRMVNALDEVFAGGTANA
ncbi:MAG TPA: aspartate aminotransferase family protein [Candidatus Krumholzibacteria bacterium]|nr:aspartate aminotransferase family protein [Candidatus Krumholzibacteria bacterium]